MDYWSQLQRNDPVSKYENDAGNVPTAMLLHDDPLASGNRNFLADQGMVQSDRKIASQLSPLLIPIRPSSKLKGYRTGAEVDYVDLRQWFFCYTSTSSGVLMQTTLD